MEVILRKKNLMMIYLVYVKYFYIFENIIKNLYSTFGLIEIELNKKCNGVISKLEQLHYV